MMSPYLTLDPNGEIVKCNWPDGFVLVHEYEFVDGELVLVASGLAEPTIES